MLVSLSEDCAENLPDTSGRFVLTTEFFCYEVEVSVDTDHEVIKLEFIDLSEDPELDLCEVSSYGAC